MADMSAEPTALDSRGSSEEYECIYQVSSAPLNGRAREPAPVARVVLLSACASWTPRGCRYRTRCMTQSASSKSSARCW
jgi:hypothetical protein